MCDTAGVGQIWQIGRHRIGIGDCHDADFAHRVLDKAEIGALVFDPDWHQMPSTLPPFADAADVLLFAGPAWIDPALRLWWSAQRQIAHAFIWNCVTFQNRPGRPLMGCKLCFWLGNAGQYRNASKYNCPTWRGHWLGDRYDESIKAVVQSSGHKHAKPLDWIRCLLANCTTGNVYDPFLGSGSTLWACEQLGRECIGIEANPRTAYRLIERAQAEGFPCERLT
jgi:hypothetical protein